jgi:hypothetical protein
MRDPRNRRTGEAFAITKSGSASEMAKARGDCESFTAVSFSRYDSRIASS